MNIYISTKSFHPQNAVIIIKIKPFYVINENYSIESPMVTIERAIVNLTNWISGKFSGKLLYYGFKTIKHRSESYDIVNCKMNDNTKIIVCQNTFLLISFFSWCIISISLDIYYYFRISLSLPDSIYLKKLFPELL